MASRMIGRANCPECGFHGAHVKESDKCIYRYCPECSSQHHARTERQRADLMAKTRPLDGSSTATPSPSPTGAAEAEATPTPSPMPAEPTPSATPAQPAAPAKRRGLFT